MRGGFLPWLEGSHTRIKQEGKEPLTDFVIGRGRVVSQGPERQNFSCYILEDVAPSILAFVLSINNYCTYFKIVYAVHHAQ